MDSKDLTESKLHSLSEQTLAVLDSLEDDITSSVLCGVNITVVPR